MIPLEGWSLDDFWGENMGRFRICNLWGIWWELIPGKCIQGAHEVISPWIFSALEAWTFESSTVQDQQRWFLNPSPHYFTYAISVSIVLCTAISPHRWFKFPITSQQMPAKSHDTTLFNSWITFRKSKLLLVKSPWTYSTKKSVVPPWKQHICCHVITLPL